MTMPTLTLSSKIALTDAAMKMSSCLPDCHPLSVDAEVENTNLEAHRSKQSLTQYGKNDWIQNLRATFNSHDLQAIEKTSF